MSERAGIYRFLSSTRCYTAFQAWIGRPGTAQHIRYEFLPHLDDEGTRVLDIGCGPGTFLAAHGRYLKGGYIGFDPNQDYIEAARAEFPDRQFHVGSTDTVAHLIQGRFDLAVAFGVLHHVDDDEARNIVRYAHSMLRPGGRFVSIDPVFLPRQNPIARALAAIDRGKHVRTADGYRRLVEAPFGRHLVETHIQSDWLRLPYNHLVVIATSE